MEKYTYNKLSEIKNNLLKATRYEDEATIKVKVYYSNEGEITYDVEVNVYIEGEYIDGWINDTFYEGGEKDAMKRAKAVLRTVKGWFEGSDSVTVENGVEYYG